MKFCICQISKSEFILYQKNLFSLSSTHTEAASILTAAEGGRDNGPRTSQIRILLKDKLLQKSIVRGPYFFEGIANEVILYFTVSQ